MTTATEPSRQARHRARSLVPDFYDKATWYEGALPLALIVGVALPFMVAGIWSWITILTS